VRKSHENQVISILNIRKARTKVKNIYWKSNKKFQLRLKNPEDEKYRREKLE
jgi:hypothetical protein